MALSRRSFFRLGAAASTAAVAGSVAIADLVAAPPAAAVPFDPAAGPVQALTSFEAVAGTRTVTVAGTDFVGVSGGAGTPSLRLFSTAIYNEGAGGLLVATVHVPAGGRVVRVDCYGVRGTSGTQTWNLTKMRVIDGAPTPIGSFTSPTGTSEAVQAGGALGTPVTVADGEVLLLAFTGSSIENAVLGAVVHYVPASGAFVPLRPTRVYDTRTNGAGAIAAGQTRSISVLGSPVVVPAGASAVAYNVTVTGTVSSFGYLSIYPADLASSAFDHGSAINWDRAGATLANASQVALAPTGEVKVTCGGAATAATDVLLDVLGYYL